MCAPLGQKKGRTCQVLHWGQWVVIRNYGRQLWNYPTLCSLNIPNNSLYNASYYMCSKITSHRQPLFSKKTAAAASFSYKIGGGGLNFQQNWRRRQGFGNITGGCSDMVWILVRGWWFIRLPRHTLELGLAVHIMWTAFDGTDSTIHAVIYIVLLLSIFTDLKLERIIGLPYLRI